MSGGNADSSVFGSTGGDGGRDITSGASLGLNFGSDGGGSTTSMAPLAKVS